MKTTAYSWDEVGCKVGEWPVELPDGLDDEDALLLADARIAQACSEGMGTIGRAFRTEDGVAVLDARFGRDKVTRTYLCPDDPERARALAEEELEAYLDE